MQLPRSLTADSAQKHLPQKGEVLGGKLFNRINAPRLVQW